MTGFWPSEKWIAFFWGKKALWWPLLGPPLRLPTLPPPSRPRASRINSLKNSKNGVRFDNAAATATSSCGHHCCHHRRFAAATLLLETSPLLLPQLFFPMLLIRISYSRNFGFQSLRSWNPQLRSYLNFRRIAKNETPLSSKRSKKGNAHFPKPYLFRFWRKGAFRILIKLMKIGVSFFWFIQNPKMELWPHK